MALNKIQTNANAIDYDYVNDSLYLFTKGANYSHSLNLDNIIIDFGEGEYDAHKEFFIKGVEIQNASKKFGIKKYALRHPQEIDIELTISSEKIELNISLTVIMRNKSYPKAIVADGINESNIPSGTMAMSCAVC